MKYSIAILSCLLVTALAVHTAAVAEEHPQRVATPVSVHVQPVMQEQIISDTEVVGTVQAVNQAAIAARVNGIITEITVVLGSRVKKGDLLVRISADEIAARVRRAQAELAQARRNLAREKKLLKKHASTPETVKSLQDLVAVAEAGFQEASSMLAYTSIHAPYDGVVIEKIAHVGDLANPGRPLMLLADDSHLQVVSAIPEQQVHLVRPDEELAVSIPSLARQVTGTVAEIAPAIDPHSHTAQVKLNIPSDTVSLRIGQFVRLRLPGSPVATLFVPERAVLSVGQMDKVFTVRDSRAHLRLVRTGARSNDKIEILAGLDPGDQVIIDNNRHLVNGTPVTVEP